MCIIYTCVYLCMYTSVCMHVCVHVHECALCACVCMCVYVHMYVYIHTCVTLRLWNDLNHLVVLMWQVLRERNREEKIKNVKKLGLGGLA